MRGPICHQIGSGPNLPGPNLPGPNLPRTLKMYFLAVQASGGVHGLPEVAEGDSTKDFRVFRAQISGIRYQISGQFYQMSPRFWTNINFNLVFHQKVCTGKVFRRGGDPWRIVRKVTRGAKHMHFIIVPNTNYANYTVFSSKYEWCTGCDSLQLSSSCCLRPFLQQCRPLFCLRGTL